jgi:hypothetical protein
MALSKIDTKAIADDAVDNTKLDLADNYAFTGTVTGAGITAGQASDPSFHAYQPQNGSVANNTTIIVSNNTELFDSSSAYNTSDYRFTPQVGNSQYDRIDLSISKNGSTILSARNSNEDYTTCNVCGMVQANGSSDYFDMRSYQGSGSSANITPDDEYTYFGGFLIKKT